MDVFVNFNDNVILVNVPENGNVYDLKCTIQEKTGVNVNDQCWLGLDMDMEQLMNDIPVVACFRPDQTIFLIEKEKPKPSHPKTITFQEPPSPRTTHDKSPRPTTPSQTTTKTGTDAKRNVRKSNFHFHPETLRDLLNQFDTHEDEFTFDYEKKFGYIHPDFIGGRFSNIYEACRLEKKPLVVFIYNFTDPNTICFCSLAISPDSSDRTLVQKWLKDNEIPLWIGGLNLSTETSFRTAFKELPQPLMFLVAHMKGTFTILQTITSQMTARELVNALERGASIFRKHLNEEAEKLNEILIARELAAEQDRAFQRSLKEDKKKENELSLLRKAREEAAIELEDKLSRLRKAREEAVTELERLSPEPVGTEKAIQIGVKMLDGSRLERKFSPSCKLQDLFSFVKGVIAKSKADNEYIDDTNPGSPWDITKYELIQNFPKKVLSLKDADKLLSECDLGSQSLLFLQKSI